MGNALLLLNATTPVFGAEVLSTAFEKSSEGPAIVDHDRIPVFFRKPFTGAALLEKVREVLDASNLAIWREQIHEEK